MADQSKIRNVYYGGPTQTGQMVDKGLSTIMHAIPGVGRILGPVYNLLSGGWQLASDKIEQNRMDKMPGVTNQSVDIGAINPYAGRQVNQGTVVKETDIIDNPVHVGNQSEAFGSMGTGIFSSLINRGGDSENKTLFETGVGGVNKLFNNGSKPIPEENIVPFISKSAQEESVLNEATFNPYLNEGLNSIWKSSVLSPDTQAKSTGGNLSSNPLINNNTPVSQTPGVSIKGITDSPVDIDKIVNDLKNLGIY